MAGSFKHCVDDNYNFLGEKHLLDDMGDAYEACEQMVFMIRYLSGADKNKINAAVDAFYQSKNPKYKPEFKVTGDQKSTMVLPNMPCQITIEVTQVNGMPDKIIVNAVNKT